MTEKEEIERLHKLNKSLARVLKNIVTYLEGSPDLLNKEVAQVLKEFEQTYPVCVKKLAYVTNRLEQVISNNCYSDFKIEEQPEATMQSLGCDSMEYVDLCMCIEEEFDGLDCHPSIDTPIIEIRNKIVELYDFPTNTRN